MKSLPIAITLVALGTSAASADVYIGLQVGNGAISQVASDPHNAVWSGPFGAFAIDNISGTDLVDLIDSQSLQVTTKGVPGQHFRVYVTATDQTALGPVRSSYTSQALQAGWVETLSSWRDPGNGIFALTEQLGSATFASIGTSMQDAAAGVGVYSITTLYDLVAPTHGIANATIHVADVPEPSTLALFGGFLTLGWLGLRRRVANG